MFQFIAFKGTDMDNIERKILQHMQRDATLSVADLAEIAGISKSACWRRIQKLEQQGVIRKRVTLMDPVALDLSLTVFIAVKTNQHNERWAQQFNTVVQDIPGILEVYRMGGDVDYMIKAVVKDMPGYDALYQQLLKADLFDVSASYVMEALKQTTELPL